MANYCGNLLLPRWYFESHTITFFCCIILTSHSCRSWPTGERVWVKYPKLRTSKKPLFKFPLLSLCDHRGPVFIHMQPEDDSGGRARSGANLTYAPANRFASFGCEGWAFVVARKLRAIVCHVTRRTSAVFIGNGAKSESLSCTAAYDPRMNWHILDWRAVSPQPNMDSDYINYLFN